MGSMLPYIAYMDPMGINIYYLVGGLEHEFYFPFHIWDVILPIDELIFFKMVKTTNQNIYDINQRKYGKIMFHNFPISGLMFRRCFEDVRKERRCPVVGSSNLIISGIKMY
jgi:hypothetical protein